MSYSEIGINSSYFASSILSWTFLHQNAWLCPKISWFWLMSRLGLTWMIAWNHQVQLDAESGVISIWGCIISAVSWVPVKTMPSRLRLSQVFEPCFKDHKFIIERDREKDMKESWQFFHIILSYFMAFFLVPMCVHCRKSQTSSPYA